MRSFLAIPVLLLVLVAVAQTDEEKVPLDKVPKTVLKAVQARFPHAKVVSAGKETDAGKVLYEIAITTKDQKIEVTLTPDGKIVEMEKQIAAKDLPKAVSGALEMKYPKATYRIIEEIILVQKGKEQPPFFEVLLLTADQKQLEVSLTPDGAIVKEENQGKEEEAKKVTLIGTLRTGIVAVGGETTGTILETKEGKYELDFGQNKELRQKAAKLNGQAVLVAGTLEIRKGVEVKERKIITVTRLEKAKVK